MFNYMTEPQTIAVDTQPQQKKHFSPKSKTKKYTVKTKKAKKTNAQIIHPGGRAKSNRWQKRVVVSDGDAIADIVDFEEPLCETVPRQVLPTEGAWTNRLYTISGEEKVQIW